MMVNKRGNWHSIMKAQRKKTGKEERREKKRGRDD